MARHECPGGCGESVPQHRLACRRCWFRLPGVLRRPLVAAWQDGNRSRHRELLVEAVDWYRDHPHKVSP